MVRTVAVFNMFSHACYVICVFIVSAVRLSYCEISVFFWHVCITFDEAEELSLGISGLCQFRSECGQLACELGVLVSLCSSSDMCVHCINFIVRVWFPTSEFTQRLLRMDLHEIEPTYFLYNSNDSHDLIEVATQARPNLLEPNLSELSCLFLESHS